MRVGPSRVRANRGKSRDGRYDTAYCNVRSLVFAFVATVSRLRGPGADPAGGYVPLSCPACVGSATFLSPSHEKSWKKSEAGAHHTLMGLSCFLRRYEHATRARYKLSDGNSYDEPQPGILNPISDLVEGDPQAQGAMYENYATDYIWASLLCPRPSPALVI